MKTSHLLRALSAFTLFLASSGVVQAQSHPSQAVRLISPFPAGVAADLLAHTVSQNHHHAGQRIGQVEKAITKRKITLD